MDAIRQNSAESMEMDSAAAMNLQAFVAFSCCGGGLAALCYRVDSTVPEHALPARRTAPKNAAAQ